MCHADPMRLHGVALTIVVISNIPYSGGRPISHTHTQGNYIDTLTIVIIAYVLFTAGMKSGHPYTRSPPKSSNTHEGSKILLFKIDSRDLAT